MGSRDPETAAYVKAQLEAIWQDKTYRHYNHVTLWAVMPEDKAHGYVAFTYAGMVYCHRRGHKLRDYKGRRR